MSGLQTGDRLQNFMRCDQSGQQRIIYQDFCGRPLVLLVAAGDQAPQQIKALDQNEALLRQVARVVIIAGDPQAADRVAKANGVRLPVLADDGGIVQYLLGATPTAPAALVFDSNLRLLGRQTADGSQYSLAEWAAGVLADQSPAEDRVVTSQAPVLVIPRVFDQAFCQELISFFDREGSYESGVYRMEQNQLVFRPDPKVKQRRDHSIEDQDLWRRIQAILVRRVVPEIQWAFGFQVTRFEQFKLICYNADSGGYFRPHRDNDSPDTAHRRFAMTLNLNSGQYQGGELRFPEYGDQRYQATTGGAVVFSCNLAHEALDVTEGKRYALLSFFFGEEDEQRRLEQVAKGNQQPVVGTRVN